MPSPSSQTSVRSALAALMETKVAGLTIDALGRKWDASKHPRDSRGRFIETGGIARVGLGGLGKVIRSMIGGKVEVEMSDGKHRIVPHQQLTMVRRPDGSKPTSSVRKVVQEDSAREKHDGRGDGKFAADHNPDIAIPNVDPADENDNNPYDGDDNDPEIPNVPEAYTPSRDDARVGDIIAITAHDPKGVPHHIFAKVDSVAGGKPDKITLADKQRSKTNLKTVSSVTSKNGGTPDVTVIPFEDLNDPAALMTDAEDDNGKFAVLDNELATDLVEGHAKTTAPKPSNHTQGEQKPGGGKRDRVVPTPVLKDDLVMGRKVGTVELNGRIVGRIEKDPDNPGRWKVTDPWKRSKTVGQKWDTGRTELARMLNNPPLPKGEQKPTPAAVNAPAIPVTLEPNAGAPAAVNAPDLPESDADRYRAARYRSHAAAGMTERNDAQDESAKIARAARKRGVELDEITLDEEARKQVLADAAAKPTAGTQTHEPPAAPLDVERTTAEVASKQARALARVHLADGSTGNMSKSGHLVATKQSRGYAIYRHTNTPPADNHVHTVTVGDKHYEHVGDSATLEEFRLAWVATDEDHAPTTPKVLNQPSAPAPARDEQAALDLGTTVPAAHLPDGAAPQKPKADDSPDLTRLEKEPVGNLSDDELAQIIDADGFGTPGRAIAAHDESDRRATEKPAARLPDGAAPQKPNAETPVPTKNTYPTYDETAAWVKENRGKRFILGGPDGSTFNGTWEPVGMFRGSIARWREDEHGTTVDADPKYATPVESPKAPAPRRLPDGAALQKPKTERPSPTPSQDYAESETPKEPTDGPLRADGADVLGDVPAVPGRNDQRPAGVLPRPERAGGGSDRAGAPAAADDPAGSDSGDDRGSAQGAAAAGDGSGAGRSGVPAAGAGDRGQEAAGDSAPGLGDRPDPVATPPAPAPKKPARKTAGPSVEKNLDALRTLRTIEAEGRPATADERKILAGWSGWGALPKMFDDSDEQYATERAELKDLIGEDGWRKARTNMLNAHYTDPALVASIWDGLKAMGFTGGDVLEPGSGSGNFIAQAPAGTHMTGVEVEPVTAGISRALHPDAEIHLESFAKSPFRASVFDAVIGNVPFGSFSLLDRKHNSENHSIHNHFIIKGLDTLKPGGVMAVVSSSFTLDNSDPRAREAMFAQADLIGAVRLPENAHDKTAGTSVVTDVLLFRKRKDGDAPGDDTWLRTSEARDSAGNAVVGIKRGESEPTPQSINDYFTTHPDDLLGELRSGGYNGLKVVGSGDNAAKLRERLSAIAATARKAGRGFAAATTDKTTRPALRDTGSTREGRIALKGTQADAKGKSAAVFERIEDGEHQRFEVPSTQADEFAALLELRDLYEALMQAEVEAKGDDDDTMNAARAALRNAYRRYVAKYGPVSRYTVTEKAGTARTTFPPVMGKFRQDEGAAVVYGLESDFDPDTNTAKAADVLQTRQMNVSRTVAEHTDNPEDAIALATERDGGLTAKNLAEVLQTTPAKARAMVKGLVFNDPENPGKMVSKAAYLSGNVRKKLAAVDGAAEDDMFAENAAALREVLPPDATLADMPMQLGSAFITADIVTKFARHLMGRQSTAEAINDEGQWRVPTPSKYGRNQQLESDTWGTQDRNFYQLLESILKGQHRIIRITRKNEDGSSYVDKKASEEAALKAQEIEQEFQDFVWAHPDIGDALAAAYTERHRSLVPRTYDGAAQRDYPGMAEWLTLRPHQNAAVTRAVNEPAVMFEHVVGAGKTYTLAGGAMELKRLGLIRKPVLAVPGHMLAQWTKDFREAYPNAKILAADSDVLAGKENRKRFAAMAANNDWDVVLMTHTAFESIPTSLDWEEKYLNAELDRYERQLRNAQQSGDKRREKSIQNNLEKLRNKIEERLSKRKDDDGITFESIGFDYVMADEAHVYKNLDFQTGMQGIQSPEGSGRARDMHMKLELLRSQKPTDGTERVVAFATGTPISNSLAEMYTMTRMLRPDLLEEAGISDFDSWAATFATVSAKVEQDTSANGWQERVRMRGFTDALGDALRIWRTFSDTKTASDLNLPRPALKGGARQVHVVQPSDAQLEALASFKERVETLPPGRAVKGDDTHVAIIGDGRRAAIDPRLMSARGLDRAGISRDDEIDSPKLDEAANEISRIWRAHKDDKFKVEHDSDEDAELTGALQMVMIDSDAPKKDQRSSYQMLKDRLIQAGVPAGQIRFVQEAAGSSEKKARLFEDARQGRVSVLIGSTAALGTGTNVQNRLYALHHIDGSWKPSDIEQREGRILRQGNQFPEVEVHAYVTERTHDVKTWDMTSYKQAALDAIAHGSYDMRGIEFADDVDPLTDYDTITGLASGDPLVQDRRDLTPELKRLQGAERAHKRQIDRAKGVVQAMERQTDVLARRRQILANALSRRQDISGDNFKMTLTPHGGWRTKPYDTRKDAGEALMELVLKKLEEPYWAPGMQTTGIVGQIGGFDIRMSTINDQGAKRQIAFELTINPAHGEPLPLSPVVIGESDARGNIEGALTRLENRTNGLEAAIGKIDAKTTDLAAEREAAEAATTRRFRFANDLADAERRALLLDKLLTKKVDDQAGENTADLREEYDKVTERSKNAAAVAKAERMQTLKDAAGVAAPPPAAAETDVTPAEEDLADATLAVEVAKTPDADTGGGDSKPPTTPPAPTGGADVPERSPDFGKRIGEPNVEDNAGAAGAGAVTITETIGGRTQGDTINRVLWRVEKRDGVWGVYPPSEQSPASFSAGSRKEALAWALDRANGVPDPDEDPADAAPAARLPEGAAPQKAKPTPDAPSPSPDFADRDEAAAAGYDTPVSSTDELTVGDRVVFDTPADGPRPYYGPREGRVTQIGSGGTEGQVQIGFDSKGRRSHVWERPENIMRNSTAEPAAETKPEAGSPEAVEKARDTAEQHAHETGATKKAAKVAGDHAAADEATAAADKVGETPIAPEPPAEPKTPRQLDDEKFPLTPQQQPIADAVVADRKDVLVEAGAGAGKTSTLEAIAKRFKLSAPDEQIAYVAFNKTVQTEAEGRMPGNVEPRTGHSIAWAWAGRDFTKKRDNKDSLRRADEIARFLGITEPMTMGDETLSPAEQAQAAIGAVDTWSNSADDKIGSAHLSAKYDALTGANKVRLLSYATKAWDDLTDKNGRIKVSFDHIRKMWALSNPDLSKPGSGLQKPATVLFLDEAQDTPPVLAKVIEDQTIQKVIVGDTNQAIYGFTGAIDYLKKAKTDEQLPLTKSWRFGPQIADMGNRFLQVLGAKERVEGGGPESNIVRDMANPDAILVRSNGGMIAEILREQENGRTVGVPKGTKADLISLAESARYLKGEGGAPERMHEDLAPFRTWAEVEKAAEDDQKLAMLNRIVSEYGVNRLEQIVRDVVELEDGLNGIRFEQHDHGLVATGKGTFDNRDRLKAAGFRWMELPGGGKYTAGKNAGQPIKAWTAVGTPEQQQATLDRAKEGAAGVKPDVTISTAHKSKGLEWDRVRIGSDFKGPEESKTGDGELTMPPDEELKLAYVAVTRAAKELDPGSLGWVLDHSDPNGGDPHASTAQKPVETASEQIDVPVPTDSEHVAETVAGPDVLELDWTPSGKGADRIETSTDAEFGAKVTVSKAKGMSGWAIGVFDPQGNNLNQGGVADTKTDAKKYATQDLRREVARQRALADVGGLDGLSALPDDRWTTIGDTRAARFGHYVVYLSHDPTYFHPWYGHVVNLDQPTVRVSARTGTDANEVAKRAEDIARTMENARPADDENAREAEEWKRKRDEDADRAAQDAAATDTGGAVQTPMPDADVPNNADVPDVPNDTDVDPDADTAGDTPAERKAKRERRRRRRNNTGLGGPDNNSGGGAPAGPVGAVVPLGQLPLDGDPDPSGSPSSSTDTSTPDRLEPQTAPIEDGREWSDLNDEELAALRDRYEDTATRAEQAGQPMTVTMAQSRIDAINEEIAGRRAANHPRDTAGSLQVGDRLTIDGTPMRVESISDGWGSDKGRRFNFQPLTGYPLGRIETWTDDHKITRDDDTTPEPPTTAAPQASADTDEARDWIRDNWNDGNPHSKPAIGRIPVSGGLADELAHYLENGETDGIDQGYTLSANKKFITVHDKDKAFSALDAIEDIKADQGRDGNRGALSMSNAAGARKRMVRDLPDAAPATTQGTVAVGEQTDPGQLFVGDVVEGVLGSTRDRGNLRVETVSADGAMDLITGTNDDGKRDTIRIPSGHTATVIGTPADDGTRESAWNRTTETVPATAGEIGMLSTDDLAPGDVIHAKAGGITGRWKLVKPSLYGPNPLFDKWMVVPEGRPDVPPIVINLSKKRPVKVVARGDGKPEPTDENGFAADELAPGDVPATRADLAELFGEPAPMPVAGGVVDTRPEPLVNGHLSNPLGLTLPADLDGSYSPEQIEFLSQYAPGQVVINVGDDWHVGDFEGTNKDGTYQFRPAASTSEADVLSIDPAQLDEIRGIRAAEGLSEPVDPNTLRPGTRVAFTRDRKQRVGVLEGNVGGRAQVRDSNGVVHETTIGGTVRPVLGGYLPGSEPTEAPFAPRVGVWTPEGDGLAAAVPGEWAAGIVPSADGYRWEVTGVPGSSLSTRAGTTPTIEAAQEAVADALYQGAGDGAKVTTLPGTDENDRDARTREFADTFAELNAGNESPVGQDPTDQTAAAPEIDGATAGWVPTGELQPGDVARVDGDDGNGSATTRTGHVLGTPEQVEVHSPTGKPKKATKTTIGSDRAGLGDRETLLSPEDSVAARVERPDDEGDADNPASAYESQILAGRVGGILPTDADGLGVYPGSVVTDSRGRQGYVTEVWDLDAGVRWTGKDTDERVRPGTLHVTQQARPAGWTVGGRKVEAGQMVTIDGGTPGRVSSVQGDDVDVEHDGTHTTASAGDLKVVGNVSDHADPDGGEFLEPTFDAPPSIEGLDIRPTSPVKPDALDGQSAEVRPNLNDDDRQVLGELGLDTDATSPYAVQQAAARLRHGMPIAGEQAKDLSAWLGALLGSKGVPPGRARKVKRLRNRIDAAAQRAGGAEPAPRNATGVPQLTTADQIARGDQIAVPNPATGEASVGTVRGVWPIQNGQVVLTTVEHADGTWSTHRLNPDGEVYLLPDTDAIDKSPEVQAPANVIEQDRSFTQPRVSDRLQDAAAAVINAADGLDDAAAPESLGQLAADVEDRLDSGDVARDQHNASRRNQTSLGEAGISDESAAAAHDAAEEAADRVAAEVADMVRETVADAEPLPGESDQTAAERVRDRLRDAAEEVAYDEVAAAALDRASADADGDVAVAPTAREQAHAQREIADAMRSDLFALADQLAALGDTDNAQALSDVAARLAGRPDEVHVQRAIAAASMGRGPSRVRSLAARIRGMFARARRNFIDRVQSILEQGKKARRSWKAAVAAARTEWKGDDAALGQLVADAARHLGDGTDALVGDVATVEPTGFADRMRYWAEELPEASGMFGRTERESRGFRGLTLDRLRSGATVTDDTLSGSVLDRAADGGPGTTALAHHAAVTGMGRAIRDEVNARIRGVLPEFGDDPASTVRDAWQHAERLEREERGDLTDDELAALRSKAREEARSTARMYANARAEALASTLAQVRPMGPQGSATLNVQGRSADAPEVAALRWAEQFLPTDWLASAGTVEATAGRMGSYDGDGGITVAPLTEGLVDGAGTYGASAVHGLAHHLETVVPGLTEAGWVHHWIRTSSGPLGSRKRLGANGLGWLYDLFPGIGLTKDDGAARGAGWDGVESDGEHYEWVPSALQMILAGSEGQDDDDLEEFMLGLLAWLGRNR